MMSKQTGDYLPDDIQADILSRLPVKDLLRFKSVCKSWSALIADPYFINLHKNRAPRIFIDGETDHAGISSRSSQCLNTFFPIRKEEILSSTNGLLCVKTSDGKYAISNPATRKLVQIPAPDHEFFEFKLYTVPSTGELKVVGCHIDHLIGAMYWDILTIGASSPWRTVPVDARWCTSLLFDDGPHCLSCKEDASRWEEDIISLDLETQQVFKHVMPCQTDLFIAEWDGCLSASKVVRQELRTWILEDHRSNRWRKEVVDLSFMSKELIDKPNFFLNYSGKMWWAKNYRSKDEHVEVFSIDLKSKRKEYSDTKSRSMYDIFTYVPTLETLEGM